MQRQRGGGMYIFIILFISLAAAFLAGELTDAAMRLLRDNYKWHKPLRSIGVRATQLVLANEIVQLSFFEDESKRQRRETLECTLDSIRRRFGHHCIDVALMSTDSKLGKLDAKSENTIGPVGYFKNAS